MPRSSSASSDEPNYVMGSFFCGCRLTAAKQNSRKVRPNRKIPVFNAKNQT